MSLPNVAITIERQGLGAVATTTDGIMGLILTGIAVTGKLVLNTAYAIYSLDEAGTTLGITSVVNPAAYKQIKEFYDTAAPGAKLWVVVCADTTTIETRVLKSATPCPAKVLLDAALGEVSVIGVCWTPTTGYTFTAVNGLDPKVASAVTNAQSLADDYVALIMPVSFIIEGRGYTGTASALTDLKGLTNARVAVMLAATSSDGSGAVGMALGRLARVPVQRKLSRVKSLALPVTTGYLTSGDTIAAKYSDMGTAHDKGYIVFRKFAAKSGFYFNDDHTATADTDDLHHLSNVRVIDKALKITYNTYVEEIDEEVAITDAGKINPQTIAYLQSKIERAINLNMAGEISKFSAYIDPNQNILSLPRLAVVLRITPVGYLTDIIVSLGFKNPALTT